MTGQELLGWYSPHLHDLLLDAVLDVRYSIIRQLEQPSVDVDGKEMTPMVSISCVT